MNKFVIMGVQGSGKGTQAKMLAQDFDLVHISVGDMIRWKIQNHTKLGARVKRLVAAGALVPDDMVEEMIHRRLAQHDWNYGFILDGFPRNGTQAEFLLESWDIDAVICIELSIEEVQRRVLSRRLCADCGLDYNLIQHRPAQPDTCDVCKGRLVARPDDNLEAVKERVQAYVEKTQPIIDIFRRKEEVVVVDGGRPPKIVQDDIRQRLGLRLPVPA